MDSKVELELNKKLAKWAGFKWQPITETWLYPSEGLRLELPDFSQSLDACFKWLVPKLTGEWTIAIANGHDFPYVATVKNLGSSTKVGNTPALALCRAIEKLIEGEKGDITND